MNKTTAADVKGFNQNATNDLNREIDRMAHEIVFRKVTSPQIIAKRMFNLFKIVIELVEWSNSEQLLEVLKQIGTRMTQKDRMNFVVRNCAERMIRILKESPFFMACSEQRIDGTTLVCKSDSFEVNSLTKSLSM